MTASDHDVALVAHLMRRAGFGASRAELENLAERGYDSVLEEMLNPEAQPDIDEDTLYRYLPMVEVPNTKNHATMKWLYWMTNTQKPLEEKVALFWHQVFATGNTKVESHTDMLLQIGTFREHGMGNLRDLLVRLAKDPAMLYWLDNNENHKRAPNENWGRELLELFALGVGSYTEKDVYECSRAFTGWTMANKIPGVPWGPWPWSFLYKAEDHDFTEKTFLGHTGDFNGEDVIDIVVRQPASAIFISRHLYNFFVADEYPVPTWPTTPPRDPEAVKAIADSLIDSGFNMRAVLRTIFTSDFFKNATYQRVKNPVEVFVNTLKITGDMLEPDPNWIETSDEPGYMGQIVLDPPTVEGWHTGREWVNSGSLINRVNFVADRVSNPDLPGVRDIISRISDNGSAIGAGELVDRCLDLIGPLEVTEETRMELVEEAEGAGQAGNGDLSRRVADVLALIAGTREYQFC